MTVLVVVGVVLAGLAVAVLRLDVAGAPRRLVSPAGGVSIQAPTHWSVDIRDPANPKNYELIVGHENSAFGFVQRGGFWVSRWPAASDITLASIQRTMLASGGDGRHDVGVEEGTLAGRPAAVLRYKTSPHGLRQLQFGDTSFVVWQTVVGDFQFQVGTWVGPRSGDTADRLARMVASVEFHAPRPWVAIADDTRVRLPGGWVTQRTPIAGATLFAVSPGDPNAAWAYVFHYRRPPAESLRRTRANMARYGNRVLTEEQVTLRNRAATRIEIEFKDAGFPNPARGTEWFVSDGRGGTYVLAVAHRSGDDTIGDRIAATWTF